MQEWLTPWNMKVPELPAEKTTFCGKNGRRRTINYIAVAGNMDECQVWKWRADGPSCEQRG